MLLTWTPVPGTIRPEPVPFEQVTLAQRPSPSTAVIWVVEPRPVARSHDPAGGRAKARPGPLGGRVEAHRVQELLEPTVLGKPGVELLGARGLRLLHHRHDLLDPGVAEPVEQVEAEGDQDAARRGRRVGEHVPATEAAPHRIAGDRLIGGEVLDAKGPAALHHPLRDRPRELAPVEGLGALRPVALQGVAELVEPEHLALAGACGPPARRSPVPRAGG